MRRPFGWDVIWCGEGLEKPVMYFGPYATLERAAWTVNRLLTSAAYAAGALTVVEVEA